MRLSNNQKNALMRLAGQRDGTFAPVGHETLRSLDRRGLASYSFGMGTGGWELTAEGRDLAAQLIIELNDAIEQVGRVLAEQERRRSIRSVLSQKEN